MLLKGLPMKSSRLPVRNRSTRKLGRLLVFFMVLISLFFAWRLVAEASFFKVTSVTIEGDPQNLVTAEIVEASLGQNLAFFPESMIRSIVIENLTVSEVSFSKAFPSTVVVTVSFRQPVLTWQSSHGRYLVDKEGLAYKLASGEPLPQVSATSSQIDLGDRLSDQEIELSLRILEITEGKFSVLTIFFQDRDVRIQLSSGVEVILDSRGDITQMQETLQLILGQAKIEGRIPRQIDLRYSKPLVNY